MSSPANAPTTHIERVWRFRRLHLCLLLVGISVRLAFSFTVSTEDSYAGWDGHEYHAYASSLRYFRGDDYPRTMNALRSPFYPIFLIPFVAVDDHATRHIQVAQCMLGALLAFILAHIAARWSSNRAGDIAFVGALFYPALAYYCAFVLTEILFSVLLWSGIACLQYGARQEREVTARWVVWAGVLFGLACLTRPGLQPFLLFAACWIAWMIREKFGWKVALRRTAIFAVVVSSLLLPWLLGNLRAHGEFSLAPGQAQAVFFYGNSPEYLQMYRATSKDEYYRVANRLAGLISVDSNLGPESWVYAAREFQRNHTRDWLQLQWYKSKHFWTPWVNPVIFGRRDVLLSMVCTTPVFILAALELWRRKRSGDPFLVLLLGIVGVGYLTGGLIFHVQVRYRIPYVEVTFLLLAASWLSYALESAMSRIRSRPTKAA